MLRLAEFRFLWPFLVEERAAYLWGALLVATSCVFLVTVPWLIGSTVGIFSTELRVDLVAPLALAMVGAVLLRGLTAFYMRTVMIGASRRIEFRLRNRLFRHLESLDASFFTTTHTGDIMNRFTSDMEAVRSSVGPGIMYSLNTIFTLGFALTLMLVVSVELTLFTLIPLVLLSVVILKLGPRVHRETMVAQERLSDVSVHAQENFSHIKVVKAFVREQAEIERMRERSDRYFDQNMRLARLRSLMMSLLWLVGDLVVLFLVALGGWELIQGEIALAEFAKFKGYQMLLIWPMVALGWVVTLFQRGAASAERLRWMLDQEPVVNDDAADPEAQITSGRVEFEHVEFAFEPGKPVLRDIDITLPAGRTLGVVGPTGAGKTVLLSLIPRLAPATGGSVRVDGRAVADYPLATLRSAIGYVPQEAFLFSATVEENIAFGVDAATPESIAAVAELVHIHDEVLGFPDGYRQRVGERGITLSGGQKQRLALARTLLRRPRILLLDDVLSAVDTRTEAAILQGLRRWTADLTTVIVSHRISTVRHADEIVVLEDGAIVERGTHDELLALDGRYARTYRRQSIEDELESL